MPMTLFDPSDEKRRLLGQTGYQWSLDDDFQEAMSVGGLGSTAHAN